MVARFRFKWSTLQRPGFLRNAMTLVSGRMLGQAIAFALTPLITRLYSPEDMGSFSLFSAVIAFLAILVSLRYEQAIVTAPTEEEASNVLALSFLIVMAMTLLTLGGVTLYILLAPLAWIHLRPLGLMWLLPVAVFLIGLYQIGNAWLTRMGEFKPVSTSLVIQSAATGGGQIAFHGSSGLQPLGLVGGQIVGQGLATVVVLVHVLQAHFATIKASINSTQMRRCLRTYRRFPLIDIWATLSNTGAHQAPFFLIGSFFGAATLGVYGLCMRVLNAPLLLISSSLSQVFFQRYNALPKETGERFEFTNKFFRSVAKVALLPFLLLAIVAPVLFKLIFGPQWYLAGVYVQYLTPMLFIRTIASPASSILWSEERQDLHLCWQLGFLSASVASLLIGMLLCRSMDMALLLFSGSSCAMYGLLIIMLRKLSRGLRLPLPVVGS